jgi:hypothetical protein
VRRTTGSGTREGVRWNKNDAMCPATGSADRKRHEALGLVQHRSRRSVYANADEPD